MKKYCGCLVKNGRSAYFGASLFCLNSVLEKEMNYIDKSMEIEDIVEKYPETIGPMQEMGVQCMVCGEPVWGTLGERISEKGLENEEEILERLNQVVSETEKKNQGAK